MTRVMSPTSSGRLHPAYVPVLHLLVFSQPKLHSTTSTIMFGCPDILHCGIKYTKRPVLYRNIDSATQCILSVAEVHVLIFGIQYYNILVPNVANDFIKFFKVHNII